MTPKEKAKEIFNKMYQVDDVMYKYPMCFDTAKQCALIAVKEISDTIENISWIKNEEYFIKANYWEDVQKEIKRL